MVNGDFAATPDVHVEYDTGITSLSDFAASVDGPGEQWVIVTPPTVAQQPAPTGTISGPRVAVAGTTGSFEAYGTVPGGTVTGYYWTFGDGRTTNATGADATHVFSEPGTYTATVTITSSFGTVITLVQNVTVVAPSSGVVSAPYDGIYYDPLPILQYTFTRTASGPATIFFGFARHFAYAQAADQHFLPGPAGVSRALFSTAYQMCPTLHRAGGARGGGC
jgi:PKD domain